ncbi:Nephrocystin-1 [Phlyctochytrium planicorne]|nr:Nephrocystin-1 [Phlyctochytrium planicorne]
MNGKGMKVEGLFDYMGSTDEELNFQKGDVLEVLNHENEDWWQKIPAESRPQKQTEAKRYSKFQTLGNLWNNGEGLMATSLQPLLRNSGIFFEDLLLDAKTFSISKRAVKTTIAFSILDGKNILEGLDEGLVAGRQIRIALYKGTELISNIHSISAAVHPDFPNIWRFSSKASLLFPKDDENTLFLRTDTVDINLFLLFEMSVQKRSESKKDSPSEHVIGWGVLPLLTSDGGPLDNKTYDIRIYEDNPIEQSGKLKARPQDQKMGAILEPSLAVFPMIACQNDLLQLLVHLWESKEKLVKKGGSLKVALTECILLIWPIMTSANFPTYVLGDNNVMLVSFGGDFGCLFPDLF